MSVTGNDRESRLSSRIDRSDDASQRSCSTSFTAPPPLPRRCRCRVDAAAGRHRRRSSAAAGAAPPPLLIPPELFVLAASPPPASRCWSATAPAAAGAAAVSQSHRCPARSPPLPHRLLAVIRTSRPPPHAASRGAAGVGPPSSLEPRCSRLRVDHHCDWFAVAAARRAAGTLVRELLSTPVSSPLHRQLSSDLLSLSLSCSLSFALSLFSLFPSLSLFSLSYPNQSLFVSS
ncbi:hypothetical protein Scep_028902 [Stephania cephalantha]|uniref:Uncharacterized protein n=1 Tax=Stephania cephalantha TaxID=152367 RepID=A0AAP0HNV2_9MAGN